MRIFVRRVPLAWMLLILGGIFGGLALYGMTTGEAYLPPGKRSPARHVSEKKDATEYRRIIRYELGIASALIALSLVRVVPVEDFFIRLNGRLQARMQNDRAPAPLWAYVFLVAFIGLIVWIGSRVMYSG